MTKQEVIEIRKKLEAVLDSTGTMMGYKFTIGKITYGESASMKLTAIAINPSTERAETPEELAYRQCCIDKCLPSDGVGRKVISPSQTEYEIVGYLKKGKKFNISAKRVSDNKLFKLRSESLTWIERYPEMVAFNDQLDKNPDDYTTRLVMADFLEEKGDDRAEGYRIMGKKKYVVHKEINIWYILLPVQWGRSMKYTWHESREKLENHAALTYRKLSKQFKEEMRG